MGSMGQPERRLAHFEALVPPIIFPADHYIIVCRLDSGFGIGTSTYVDLGISGPPSN